MCIYKQPIAGIVSALEYLECAAAEAFELLKGDSVDLKKVADSFRSSIDAARTIRSITSFMLSTVNRCLDFTKVCIPSHTLLVPYHIHVYHSHQYTIHLLRYTGK